MAVTQMKVLYHECTDENGQKLEVEFVDGNGKLWVVPFGEPTEFDDSFMADKILEHKKYMGLVEVHFTKSRTGIDYDMADAKARAIKILVVEEKRCINDYVRVQLETRVQKNFPPLPPVGRALSCVIKHKVNLLKYGLRPVGWEPPYEMDESEASHGVSQQAQPGMFAAGSTSEDRVRALENTVRALTDQITALVRGGGPGAGGSTPKSRGDSKLPPPVSASQILAADAHPAPRPIINTQEGVDDTYESIRL